MPLRLILTMFLLAAIVATADDEKSPEPAPDWFLLEIDRLSAGTGRWIADNGDYRSAEEPIDSYVTEWTSSFGGSTLRGRLFGVTDGGESPDFWEFRQYWHPARAEAVVEQFGAGGTVGIGVLWMVDDKTRSEQQFWFPDGSMGRTGHTSYFPNDDTYVTESFDIVDDEWIPRRTYVWRRVRGGN